MKLMIKTLMRIIKLIINKTFFMMKTAENTSMQMRLQKMKQCLINKMKKINKTMHKILQNS